MRVYSTHFGWKTNVFLLAQLLSSTDGVMQIKVLVLWNMTGVGEPFCCGFAQFSRHLQDYILGQCFFYRFLSAAYRDIKCTAIYHRCNIQS